jgi:hypothetical protein
MDSRKDSWTAADDSQHVLVVIYRASGRRNETNDSVEICEIVECSPSVEEKTAAAQIEAKVRVEAYSTVKAAKHQEMHTIRHLTRSLVSAQRRRCSSLQQHSDQACSHSSGAVRVKSLATEESTSDIM